MRCQSEREHESGDDTVSQPARLPLFEIGDNIPTITSLLTGASFDMFRIFAWAHGKGGSQRNKKASLALLALLTDSANSTAYEYELSRFVNRILNVS